MLSHDPYAGVFSSEFRERLVGFSSSCSAKGHHARRITPDSHNDSRWDYVRRKRIILDLSAGVLGNFPKETMICIHSTVFLEQKDWVLDHVFELFEEK